MDFTLPTMDEAAANAREFGQAISRFGVNAQEAAEAIMRVSEALCRLDTIESIMDYKIESKVEKLAVDLELLRNSQARDSNRICAIEQELYDLRPASVEETEIPNQKGDLEIFSQIVWDKNVLDLLENNIFIN